MFRLMGLEGCPLAEIGRRLRQQGTRTQMGLETWLSRTIWGMLEPRGFYKAVVASDTDRILGFTAFASGASEVMTIVQTVMTAGLPYTALRDAILTHPTMAEGLGRLFRVMST
jgi:pyruvate/2-oxoglutarate dehydrogenase complex dihydrolipoamide dehydrogenase (E3) component